MDEILKRIKNLSQEFTENGSMSCHDFSHTLRVLNLARRIGEDEKADMEIIEASALMHDLGRQEEARSGKDHAEESASIAERIMEESGYPPGKREAVIHGIKAHRFSRGPNPGTLEAKILQDADRLDAMGAIGVMRTFYYNGAKCRTAYDIDDPFCRKREPDDKRFGIDHFYRKLLKLKDGLHTETAKRIAEERQKFMTDFLERMEAEIEGNK